MSGDVWTEVKCQQLIRQFRKRPMLWDNKNHLYYKKGMKPLAWVEIGKELDIAPEKCKRKMVILMSSFRREKVKYMRNLKFGNHPFVPFQSTWFAFSAMSFLLDKDRERKRNLMDCTDTEGSDEDTDEEYQTSTSNTTKNLQYEDENLSLMTSPALDITNPKTYSKLSNQAPQSKSTGATEEQQNPTTSQPNEDEIKYFSNFIASKMMKYSETTKNAVQQAICEIIFKADQNCYEQNQEPNESNQPSTSRVKEEQPTSSDVSIKEYFSDDE